MNETHLNAPVKNCATCAHYTPGDGHNQHDTFWGSCARFGGHYPRVALNQCQWQHWQARPPTPPRRSLRQWIYDTFLA